MQPLLVRRADGAAKQPTASPLGGAGLRSLGGAGRTVVGQAPSAVSRVPQDLQLGPRPDSAAGFAAAEEESEEDWRQMRAALKRGSDRSVPKVGPLTLPSSEGATTSSSSLVAPAADTILLTRAGSKGSAAPYVAPLLLARSGSKSPDGSGPGAAAGAAPDAAAAAAAAAASKPGTLAPVDQKDTRQRFPPLVSLGAALRAPPPLALGRATSGEPLRQVAVPAKVLQRAKDLGEEREAAYLEGLRAERREAPQTGNLDSLVTFLEMNRLPGAYALGLAAGGIENLLQLLIGEEAAVSRAIEGSSMDAMDEILFREALHSARGHPSYTPRLQR